MTTGVDHGHGELADLEPFLDRDLSSLDRDELVALLRRARTAQARLDRFVQDLCAAQTTCDGAADTTSFLLDTGQVTGRLARLEARRHRFLTDHPDLRAAPAAAVDSIERASRRLGGDERDRFLERVPELAELARRVPADAVTDAVNQAVRRAQADRGDRELSELAALSRLERWTDDDTGLRHTLLVLDPIRDAEIHANISARFRALRHAAQSDDVTAIDAAVSLLVDKQPRGLNRTAVGITVDLDTLATGHHDDSVCELDDGTPVPPAVLDRFLCDPTITLLGTDRAGQVLRAIKARTASDLQRRALRAMHATCAHPGCDIGFDHCQIHHIRHWRHGGPTELGNLIPLCTTHHHGVHDLGWDYRLDPDRTVTLIPPPRHRPRPGGCGEPPPPHDTRTPSERPAPTAAPHPDRSHRRRRRRPPTRAAR